MYVKPQNAELGPFRTLLTSDFPNEEGTCSRVNSGSMCFKSVLDSRSGIQGTGILFSIKSCQHISQKKG